MPSLAIAQAVASLVVASVLVDFDSGVVESVLESVRNAPRLPCLLFNCCQEADF